MSVFKSFRYRPINEFLWDSLTQAELYFSVPPMLNDPLDCQIDLLGVLHRAVDAAQGARQGTLERLLGAESFLTEIQADMLTFGVCCFSETLCNKEMWERYAASHTGICLRYEIPKQFINDPANGIFGYSPVTYADDALFNWLIATDALHKLSLVAAAIEVMKKALTTKGDNWVQEKEARIIRPLAGPMKVERRFLTQVCFGLETTVAHRERVTSIARNAYESVTIAEIRVDVSKEAGISAYEIL